MAYGVKYRLEFSDILSFGKKVEILKKDYTGEVLPMIGSGEPVVIKWNSSNDFYKPIIGSVCQLNLLVTDTIKYDEFYKFDEREYQIKVSYSKSISETFSERVIADGGIFESLECIDSGLSYFKTVPTQYSERVVADGGIIESLNCIPEPIKSQTYNVWADYWIGYLLVDRFKELMTAAPFNISLNAFDGLGTLDNYSAPVSIDDNEYGTNSTPDNLRISKILENLDLDLDIVFINDLNFKKEINSVVSYVKYPNVTTFNNYLVELTNGFDLYNAKDQLSKLLSTYNMRIYQSLGKWYVVENSNIFDESVKSDILTLNTASTPPSNIRNLITTRLKSINNEFLNSEKFNYLGVSQGPEIISVLKSAPKELIPLDNNLTREYLQPISEIERSYNTTQFQKTFWNNNSGFEYEDFNWDITGANIVKDEVSKDGEYSLKLSTFTTFDFKCITSEKVPFPNPFAPQFDTKNLSSGVLESTKFTFSFFIESSGVIPGTTVGFKIRYFDSNNTKYWNNTDKEFQNSDFLNRIGSESTNKWQTVDGSLKTPTTAPVISFGELEIEIWSTRTVSPQPANYKNTYFDNVGLYQQGSRFQDFVFIEPDDLSSKITIKAKRDISDNNYSSDKSISSLVLFKDDAPTIISNWYRTRDNNFINGNTIKFNNISNISNQSIMNDFRDFCIRYEGSFRGKNPTPLSLRNKIWFNWLGYIQDEESSVVDGLTYLLKSNKYKVNSHVPNNNNDLPITVRITN
jgi:hypothetical protein